MTIAFHGGARSVTGSKHLITLDSGVKVLLDCGMFQGMGPDTAQLNSEFGFNAAEVDVVLLSHAHIDHSGLLPKLVKEGFAGNIYCTPATRALTEILLFDSAEIQTYEKNLPKSENGALSAAEPLYTNQHVTETLARIKIVAFEEWCSPVEGVEVMFTHTGHLIGAAAINLKVQSADGPVSICFSGDVGRYHSMLLAPPAAFPQADYLVLESTYGNRLHQPVFNTIEEMAGWINDTCIKRQGKLIIPAFSVGRTQEILYVLNQLSLEKKLPAVKYFVDSPLSIEATENIKQFAGEFNSRLQQVLQVDDDPFEFSGLCYVQTVEESRQLTRYDEPCVIISASGTADAGRVRHHIAAHVGDPNNTILLAGYCEAYSLGGLLLGGARQVELFGEAIAVQARIGQVRSLSAHGDYHDLLEFVACQNAGKVQKVFLVHGEYDVQQDLAARLQAKGFQQVEIPARHQQVSLGGAPARLVA